MYKTIVTFRNLHSKFVQYIIRQIFNKLVNMGIGFDITIDDFFAKLQIDDITYLLALQCTLCKLTLFFKHKPNVYARMYFTYIQDLY